MYSFSSTINQQSTYTMENHNNIIFDPYDHLKIVLNEDGTLTRLYKPNELPPTQPESTHQHNVHVLSKDVTINPSKNTWARVYVPRKALERDPCISRKLPLLLTFHGGGFILLINPASTEFHVFCEYIALDLQAVVFSVGYSLAPENRLPAAYDDAVQALHWIKATEDDWVSKLVDFGRCYVMGCSAGGNIAYHAGLRVAESRLEDLEPIKIEGLILHQPFFGGTQRTKSEQRLVNDLILPLGACDLMWELSLPEGVDRDHEYCNPMVHGGSNALEKIKALGWKILVVGCGGDPLVDRQIEFSEMLRSKGVNVSTHFTEGDCHAVEYLDTKRGRRKRKRREREKKKEEGKRNVLVGEGHGWRGQIETRETEFGRRKAGCWPKSSVAARGEEDMRCCLCCFLFFLLFVSFVIFVVVVVAARFGRQNARFRPDPSETMLKKEKTGRATVVRGWVGLGPKAQPKKKREKKGKVVKLGQTKRPSPEKKKRERMSPPTRHF